MPAATTNACGLRTLVRMNPVEPPDGDRAGLSPEEEEAFASIAFTFGARQARIPWGLVAVCVPVVGVAVVGAALLGVPGAALVTFVLTFVMALAVGLLVLAISDRRVRRR